MTHFSVPPSVVNSEILTTYHGHLMDFGSTSDKCFYVDGVRVLVLYIVRVCAFELLRQ